MGRQGHGAGLAGPKRGKVFLSAWGKGEEEIHKYLQMLYLSLFWKPSAFWLPYDSGWGRGNGGI